MLRDVDMSPLGDSAIIVRLGEQADLQTNTKVRMIANYLEQHPFAGMIEFIPAFTSVTVVYDPVEVFWRENKDPHAGGLLYPYDYVERQLRQMLASIEEAAEVTPRIVEIPVCYGGEFGVDLAYVASLNSLSEDEVIEIHASGEYLVYMLGFAPGFPYLGGMDKRIAAPRKQTPRLAIPAGTVGIAGEQTGVYPIETPGGWQLIGRTPLSLFLPAKQPPTLLEAGNRIRFYPISRREYDQWKE